VGVAPVSIIRADPVERDLLLEVAEVGVRLLDERDDALARRIIGELGNALKRGRR
jgi:energy-converting hydrogenase Eha subunit E